MSTVTVLGATGRTGRLVVAELQRRGHDVTTVVRDASRAPAGTRVVVGSADEVDVLRRATAGASAVVSALGPAKGDLHLHREMAAQLSLVMAEHGIRRYVGVSGAGVNLPTDRKSRRDRVISALMYRFVPAMVQDKADEIAVWQSTGLDWTLVRPPRLVDAPATGRLEHHADTSARTSSLTYPDLATFVVDCVESGLYLGQAPLVANAAT